MNTSFNEKEPIVDSHEQALDCFLCTDLGALIVGRFVRRKRGAPLEAAGEGDAGHTYASGG